MKKIVAMLIVFGSVSMVYAQKDGSPKKALEQQLIGTWTLVSIYNIYPDGTKVSPYGENPQGMLMFDAKGNYTLQILKAIRPKVISGNKNKCTPEEYAVLVQGSNSHFGKYAVDDVSHIITFNIEHASFPNWEGNEQKRSYTYAENVIKYEVTKTTQGGHSVAEVSWRKLN